MDICGTVVELTISCRNLRNMDLLSKSDPICVVSLKDPALNIWKEIGRTEVIWDNLNPEFSKKIILTYLFEQRQILKFDLYDIDSESASLEPQDFLGNVEAALGEIVSTSSLKAFERDLEGQRGRGNHGSIKILAEEVSSCREEFTMKVGAIDLAVHTFGNNAFFFEIHKSTENAGCSLVYRSPVLKAECNKAVEWHQFQINAYSLCNGDIDRIFKFSLRKYKSTGTHRTLGEWSTTVRTLTDSSKNLPVTFQLSSGASLRLMTFIKGSHSSFLDFIRVGGVQMHCFLAIDFTASNGNPSQPNSLHYLHASQPNQYQVALRSVLEIMQDYDSDKLFPALGFGAQLPPNLEVSHEFFLNFHPSNPYCIGIEGVMDAYAKALYTVRLHGPTNFAPIINRVSKFAFSNRDGRNYFILLIITDGIISDMPQTTQAIVAASAFPLSIIIVGVGSTDFTAMKVLDADEKSLVDPNGRSMERDIVQFVPFNEILQKAGNDLTLAKIELAREILAEVPGQFLSYMRKIGVTAEQLASGISNK